MGTRSSNPPRHVNLVYEQFKPFSEWKKGGEADILLVYLPGFVKENIRVTTETKNNLRVNGERLVAGNKWSRFQEDFQIPENCNIRGIRGKFERGILTITMPWKDEAKATQSISTRAPTPAPTPRPQAKPASQASVVPSQTALSTSDTKDDRTTSQGMETPKPMQNSKAPVFSSTSADNNKSTTFRSFEPLRNQNVKENKVSTAPINETNEKNSLEMNTKPNATERSERKDSMRVIENIDNEPRKDEATITNIVQKRDDEKSGSGGYSVEDYKQVTKGPARGLNEDRELMVNMGAAVLVIVALGAYVYFTPSCRN